jgi:hypothetical protein
MANTIKLKSSVVAGKIPTTSDISKGEVAVNFADAKIFGRHPSTDAILELGGGGGGGSSQGASIMQSIAVSFVLN